LRKSEEWSGRTDRKTDAALNAARWECHIIGASVQRCKSGE